MSLVKTNRSHAGDDKYVVGPYNLTELQLNAALNSGVVETVTANTTLGVADNGKTIFVNPAATTLIQLPSSASYPGWKCTIIITEGDGGSMDQKVNIGCFAGEFFNGLMNCNDAGGSLIANGSTHDFITCSTSSTSGERFDIVADGTGMYVIGSAVDATDTLFATAAG